MCNSDFPENHGKPWTIGAERLLFALASKGSTIEELAAKFRRTNYSIYCKLNEIVKKNIKAISALERYLNNYNAAPVPEPKVRVHTTMPGITMSYSNDVTVKEKEKVMSNYMQQVSFLQENITTVEVAFSKDASKFYTYKTRLKVKTDDLVVTELAANNYRVGKVVKVHKTPRLCEGIVYKWLVCIIDTAEYEALVEKDKLTAELLEDVAYLNKRDEIQKDLFEQLALTKTQKTKLKKLLS